MNADATAIGVTITTISPERTWNRKTKQTSATTRNSISSLPLQVVDGALDQRGAVVRRDDFDAFRQARAQLVELRLHPHDGVARVVAVAHDDHATDRLALAVEFADAPAHLGPEPHFRHVAQQHGRAVLRRHHRDALEVADALRRSPWHAPCTRPRPSRPPSRRPPGCPRGSPSRPSSAGCRSRAGAADRPPPGTA